MGVKFGTEEGTFVELLELAECTKPTFAYVVSMAMLRLRTDLSHRLVVCGYVQGGICRGDAMDFPCHWFPSSTPLTRNLPSQPGKATFPITGVGQSKIRC